LALALWSRTACHSALSAGAGFQGHSCNKALARWLLKTCYSFLPCSQHRPWPRGPARLVTFCMRGLSGAFLPQALALWPCKACCGPLLAGGAFWGILAAGLGPFAPQGLLLQPSPCRQGSGGTLSGPLALQGLLQSSPCRQALLAAFLQQALALWPLKACYSPLRAGRQAFGGHSCKGPWPAWLVTAFFAQPGTLGAILPQVRMACYVSVLQGFWGHSCHMPWPARLVTALSVQAGALGGPWP
jgi:hypothetical protein